MSGCFYFPKESKEPHMELYNKSQNIFTIKSVSFHKKHELIITPFILQ